MNHTLAPGGSVTDHLALRNLSPTEVTFGLTAADGYFTRAGRFDTLPSSQASKDAGTWIELPQSVTVPSGETSVVKFTLTVPQNAEPGDHAAGITASVIKTQSDSSGASVGVESRVGVRVTTRVTGELRPSVDVGRVSARYHPTWNPFKPGRVTVEFDAANQGNVRLLAQGQVTAGTGQAAYPGQADDRQELLPGDSRGLAANVSRVWPLFRVPVVVELSPEVVTMDGTESSAGTVRARVWVWAVPWPQLSVLLGVLLLVGAVVWGRVKSRRRLARMLAQAREEGRQLARDVPDGNDQ
jgi:hypothetical protein